MNGTVLSYLPHHALLLRDQTQSIATSQHTSISNATSPSTTSLLPMYPGTKKTTGFASADARALAAALNSSASSGLPIVGHYIMRSKYGASSAVLLRCHRQFASQVLCPFLINVVASMQCLQVPPVLMVELVTRSHL